jgi:3-deoxy-D-manno-octulosonic acid kinase
MSLVIQSISEEIENRYIIYDAQLAGQLSADWFVADYWRNHGQLQAVNAGRGQAWFVSAGNQQYVLRHYRRGGLAAKISTDRYVWSGLDRTRAWREYQILVKLQALSLPAPRPVGAHVVRHGAFYTADILTVTLPDCESLSRNLQAHALPENQWREIGKCIRRFHEHDIYHADLNAHNILLDQAGQVYVIDFDKSRIDQDHSWHPLTLQRLHRSLRKLQNQHAHFNFSDKDWQALQAGYTG